MVPVLVRHVTDQERLELALVENIQRSDLTPLETAEAYRHLSEDFHLSHDEIARQVGKNRVTVTNTLRLLNLAEIVRQALANEKISEGHARALLALSSSQAQSAALATVLKLNLTVRQTEELVRNLNGEKSPSPAHRTTPPEILALEERLRAHLGTRVSLKHGSRGGSLTIHYYSDEELNGLIDKILKE
jgi:ParB family transcriptional regulator, chromosome partitioning protein